MKLNNEMSLTFLSLSENEAFARVSVASFCSILNPTIDELSDIKTAVSEAVTNAVVHAYPNSVGKIRLDVKIISDEIYITVTDFGVGISDIEKAKEPFYTSKPNSERSGMGFSVMEEFMDRVLVESESGKGVKVTLMKKVGVCKLAVGG